MAVPLHLTGASINCPTKVFAGLKSQSTSNLTVGFYQKMNKSLQIRSRNKRGGVSMMAIGTPIVPYKIPGPGGRYQWVDLWNAFYRDRIVFIGKVIDEDFSNQMLGTLLYLDSLASEEPILLYINSPGGDLSPCLALYDTILSLQSSVGTMCMSLAGDMAGFMLAAGDKGKRSSMPLAKIEIRSPRGSAGGRADDVQVEAQELLRVRNYLFNQFAKHTGQPVEKIYEDLSTTKRFRGEEAIAYGIIDRCVKPQKKDEDSAARKAKRRDFGLR